MRTSSRDKFRKSMDQQWSMRFNTRNLDGDSYHGVVLHIGRTFVVLREVRDLIVDGLILLPKRAITGVRDGRFEACENEILRQNGALKRMKAPAWLSDCDSIADVLTHMMKRSVWPGIETLPDDGSPAFYLGPLQEVSEKEISILSYDAAGQWERTYDLPLRDVFRIEFNSRYCDLFNRYMRTKGHPSLGRA